MKILYTDDLEEAIEAHSYLKQEFKIRELIKDLDNEKLIRGITQIFIEEEIYWITKNEEKIKIQDMDDNHLINAIKFLERVIEAFKINKSEFYKRNSDFFSNNDFDQYVDIF